MAEQLRQILAANRTVILSVYGQVFFVLGLAIALQSWRHSRLMLARSLSWLAAFGFMHAFYEWGDIFIPLQSTYLPLPLTEFLLSLQSILLAVSFSCLFQFGIETLRPLPRRWRWLRYLPVALLFAWCAWGFGPALAIASDTGTWHLWQNIAARYALGLPGGLLAAYGLTRQGRVLELELRQTNITRQLRIAGLMLAGYALLAGLITRPASFFPANTLNLDRVEAAILVPVPLLRSLLGLILTMAIIRTLEVFRVELDRRFAEMEEAQVLGDERDRIGRELHDGTLQTIYAAGLLLQAAERSLVTSDNGRGVSVAAHLQQSMDLLNQAVSDIRGYIGTLRAQPGSASLAAGLQALASDYGLRAVAEVEVRIDLPEGCPLAPARIGHLLAIAREALSNVARHARASHVVLAAQVSQDRLHLEITDNGQGLPVDHLVGYGLRNMRDRARLLGGQMQLTSQPGRGTRLQVDVPWCAEEDEYAKIVTGR